MATLQIKTPTYSAIETQATKMPGSLTAYSGNILGTTIHNNNNGDNHAPKPKIRIPKKNANKPLVNLDENLFSRAPTNYVTTKAIIEESMSHKIERNYSYIEAMKEDIPYNTKTVAKNNNKSETLPLNYKNAGNKINNRLELTLQPQEFIDNKKKPPLSLPASSSPSTTSSSSSTTSSNYNRHINNVKFSLNYLTLNLPLADKLWGAVTFCLLIYFVS